jgi:hypothetical protein
MANITTTNVDSGAVVIGDAVFKDELLKFGAADTFIAGTILARKIQSDTIALGTVTGTGDRAMVATALAGRTPTIGAYTLTAGTLSSQVGTWTLTSPNGYAETFTSTAAGDTLKFYVSGIQITVVGSGGTAYTTGATRSVTVAVETGTPLIPYVSTGTNGEQEPCAVLTYGVTSGSAQNIPIRACVSGIVNQTRLLIDADGAGVTTNITKPVLDKLRAAGIVCVPVNQTAKIDNPQ